MARVCELSGVRPKSGNHVSHSNRRVKRRFEPNLHPISFHSEALRSTVRLLVTTRILRTVEKRGGLDSFLLSTDDTRLPEGAQKLKRRVRKALASRKAKTA